MMRRGLIVGVMMGAMSGYSSAQTIETQGFMIAGQAVPPPGTPTAGVAVGGEAVEWLPFELKVDAAGVKGAPYSATAVTETTQLLSDGNRIARKVESVIYRDGEGRTRREQTFAGIGPIEMSAGSRTTVTIDDPVSGEHFILDPEHNKARRLNILDPGGLPAGAVRMKRDMHFEKGQAVGGVPRDPTTITFAAKESGDVFTFRTGRGVAPGGDAQTEPLGTEVIEGVAAEGVRSTIVIPAGRIGNERPIEIVSERWFSPELKTVVRSRHSDPRAGETVYQLTKIVRAEPDPSLFQVPADFTVEDMPGKVTTFKKAP